MPWATIRTDGSKIAQPKSRLSLMMWLYAVLIMVIRIRSAAALNAARTSSTVTGSIALDMSPSDLDDEKPVRIDRQPITRLEDGGRARLLDRGRALDDVARPKILSPMNRGRQRSRR